MDQIKIGKFIVECRKKADLTQKQLAEKLGITDRAVSKWENGKSIPDSSIMLELCKELGITVNDLLSGEVVSMDNYKKELENNLLEVIKQKEQADKRLLLMEIVIFIVCLLPLVAAIVAGYTVPMDESTAEILLVASMIPLFIAVPFMLKIEQTAGYYQCTKCGHKHIPTYKGVVFAPHIGRARYMRCPECNKKSYHKKVVSKE